MDRSFLTMGPEDQVIGIETEYNLSDILGVPGGASTEEVLAMNIMRNMMPKVYSVGEFYNEVGGRFNKEARVVEAATPECCGIYAARTAALYMRALDNMMKHRLANTLTSMTIGNPARFHLMKDGGMHVDVRIPHLKHHPEIINRMQRWLIPYLATSIFWTGKGGIKFLQGNQPIFMFSPRLETIVSFVSGGAITNRGFLSLKGFAEHTQYDVDGFGRLEILSRDALHSDTVTWIDLGITLLIVRLISQKGFPEDFPSFTPDPNFTKLRDTFKEIHKINRDPTLTETITLTNSGPMTALEIQRKYLNVLKGSLPDLTSEDKLILASFEEILEKAGENPTELGGLCECWCAYNIFSRILEKNKLDWGKKVAGETDFRGKTLDLKHRLISVDHQLKALGKNWGIWPMMVSSGRVTTLFSEAEVGRAEKRPPRSRAIVRKTAYTLAHKYGVLVANGMPSPSDGRYLLYPDDNWAILKFAKLGSEDPPTVVKVMDPTEAGVRDAIREITACIRKLKNSEPSA